MNRLTKKQLIKTLLLVCIVFLGVGKAHAWSKNKVNGEPFSTRVSDVLDSQPDKATSQQKASWAIGETSSEALLDEALIQPPARVAVSVGDGPALEAAMADATVTEINITADFALSAIGSGAELNRSIPVRNITINGHDHMIDFRGRGYLMNYGSADVEINFNNLRMFGRNYWGPIRLAGNLSAKSNITYDTITYLGSQLTHSAESNVEIRGEVVSSSVNQYVSPFDGVTYTAQTNQANFEIVNLTFKENSTYEGTTENADVIILFSGGKITVEKNAKVNLIRGGSGGEAGYNVMQVSGDVIVQEAAELTLNTVEGSSRGGVWLTAGNSSVLVEKDAKLTINTNGPINAGNAAPIYGENNTKVRVDTGGKLFINTFNSGNSTRPSIVTGSNSSFIIAKEGTFDVKSDGSGAKSLIQIGSGAVFQFADAKRVNLQLDNTNANSRLLNMNGVLDVDVQAVKAWSSSDWIEDTNESYLWSPMYGVKITNSGVNTTNVVGNSVTTQIQNSFIANFRTEKFRRLLFEYIPDVEIGITRPLTNDISSTSSQQIKGTAYPGAFVRLSLVDSNGQALEDQSLLPTGLIQSQVESEQGDSKHNYHTNADGAGNWSVSLEVAKYLEAGMRVKAYAFLNGKDDTDIALVLDGVPPEVPVLNPVRDQDTLIIGQAESDSLVRLYRNKDDSQIGVETSVNASGVYSISVPAGDSPLAPYESLYTTASRYSVDEDGEQIVNTSGKSNLQIVSDTLPPSADPLPVTIDLDEGAANLDPDPGTYVTNIKDNQDGAPGKTFRFEFVAGKGLETVEKDQVGGYSIGVRVFDAADNYVDVTVGINVIDSSVSSGETIFLVASDFSLAISDFEDLTTEALLHQAILENSQSKAWHKITGASVETEVISDGGISNSEGDYPIVIQALDVAPATYLTKEIVGTVVEDVTPTVLVNYVSIDGEQLATETLIGQLGESYVTVEKTFPGYQLKQIIGDATGIFTREPITVIYEYDDYEGQLLMETGDIDFGTVPLAMFHSTVSPPLQNIEIRITDTMESTRPWQIGASLPNGFTSNSSEPFLGELEFVMETGTVLKLNETSQVIYQQEAKQSGEYSLTWDKADDKGMFLRQFVGNKARRYSGIVEWTLSDVPGVIIPPVVYGDLALDNVIAGEDFTFQIEWLDEESASVSLYYDLNGKTYLVEADLPNDKPGKKARASLLVSAEKFSIGENELMFYAVNKEGERSQTLTKRLNVTEGQ